MSNIELRNEHALAFAAALEGQTYQAIREAFRSALNAGISPADLGEATNSIFSRQGKVLRLVNGPVSEWLATVFQDEEIEFQERIDLAFGERTQTLDGTIGEIHPFVWEGNTAHVFTLIRDGGNFFQKSREFYTALFVARGIGGVVLRPMAFICAGLSAGDAVTVTVEHIGLIAVGNTPDLKMRLPVVDIEVRTAANGQRMR